MIVRELTGTVRWMGSQFSALSISPESQDHWIEDASPAVPSLCQTGILWCERKSMFSQPGMPLPLDAHLLLPVQLPVLPSPCQFVGRQAVAGGGGWPGQLDNHPHPSLARLCPEHKGQSESCPSPEAEGPEGGKEKAHTGEATMGFSITHSSQRALTQIQTEWGSLGPILSQWEEVPWGVKSMMIIMMIELAHRDVIGSLQQLGERSKIGCISPLSQMNTWVHAKLLQSCPTLCDPMDCSPPGSSVHGILQARILEWITMPSSRGSS